MEINQPAATPVTASSAPGLFGTKIPSSVAFIVAVLLFFMPFIDIKCNDMSLQTVSGIQLATGFKMKNNSSDNSFLNDFKTDKVDETITKTTTKSDKKDPNLYAMVALGLGDKMNITVDFTPWFYIAVIAFLAAAFFCYKRMSASKG